MMQKSQLRDMKKAGLDAERKARMDNTLTQCQRFPDLPKCRQLHPQGVPPVSRAQQDAQDKVKQWHEGELENIDREHINSTKKDLKAYQGN